jgi:hypothetical protein
MIIKRNSNKTEYYDPSGGTGNKGVNYTVTASVAAGPASET